MIYVFVLTFKTNKSKLIFALIAIIALIGVFICLNHVGKNNNAAEVPISSENAAFTLNAKDNTERIAFLNQFGWETSDEATEVRQITIPETFNATYEMYNEIQLLQGFDLKNFAGQKVKSYTYEILNYPDATGSVVANILVCKDTVIGGDICSVNSDGFMQGFVANSTLDNTGALSEQPIINRAAPTNADENSEQSDSTDGISEENTDSNENQSETQNNSENNTNENNENNANENVNNENNMNENADN